MASDDPKRAPALDDLDGDEHALLLAALAAAADDFARGDHVDGFDIIAQLRAKRRRAAR